jgi:hypothetical protein
MNDQYFVDALRAGGYKIRLSQGFGNRINLLVFLSKYKLPFVWITDDNISESYEDVIDFSSTGIDISFEPNNSPRFLEMGKYPGFEPNVKIPAGAGLRMKKWLSTGVDLSIINKLKPGAKVKGKLVKLPETTIGYSIRRYYAGKKPAQIFDVPDKCFLTTDCAEQRRYNSTATQLKNHRTTEEVAIQSDGDIRFVTVSKSLTDIAADWFQLRECKQIIRLGHLSTFAEALYIYKILTND